MGDTVIEDLVSEIRNRINDAPMETERLLDRAADKLEWLYDLLRGRDNYIVSIGKWSDFVSTLRQKDGVPQP